MVMLSNLGVKLAYSAWADLIVGSMRFAQLG